MRNYRSGFISIRTILALLITMSMLPLSVMSLSYCSNIKLDYDGINDEMALLQLRRILLYSYDIENRGSSLFFNYRNNDFELEVLNNRLVLRPGYQLFLNNIDDAKFWECDNCLYLTYFKGGREYQTPIAKEKGIYIADFLDDYDD